MTVREETTLFPVTSKLVRNEWENLRRENIEPWAFMEVGDGLHVTDFYGRVIRCRGIHFAGSPREDVVLRLLDRTVTLCKKEGHEPRPLHWRRTAFA